MPITSSSAPRAMATVRKASLVCWFGPVTAISFPPCGWKASHMPLHSGRRQRCVRAGPAAAPFGIDERADLGQRLALTSHLLHVPRDSRADVSAKAHWLQQERSVRPRLLDIAVLIGRVPLINAAAEA